MNQNGIKTPEHVKMHKSGKMRIFAHKFRREFMRDWQLHLLILIPLVYAVIFQYGPMYGIQIAFRDYRPRQGIWGSDWVGFKWFEKFLGYYRFQEIFSNTIILSLYTIVVGFPLPIFLALLLNTVRHKKFKKTVQTVSYIPHFISTAVMVGMLDMVFSPVNGVYGNLYRLFGGEGFPLDIRPLEESFRHLYVWSGVWQGIGWSTIVYTAALSSVSPELHEAAELDGASRWKRIWHVDLPAIMPTVATMLILRFGSVISVGFEKAYMMQSSLNADVSEVLSTYIYKMGMGSSRDFSYGAAMGLFDAVINLSMLLLVNFICKKLTHKEVSVF